MRPGRLPGGSLRGERGGEAPRLEGLQTYSPNTSGAFFFFREKSKHLKMAQIARRNLGGKESRKGRKQDMTFFVVEKIKHLKMAQIAMAKTIQICRGWTFDENPWCSLAGTSFKLHKRIYRHSREREREREDLERGTSFDF